MKTVTEIVNQWFERVWNNNEVDYIDTGLTDICELSGLDVDTIRNPKDFHRFHQKMNDTFDCIHIDIDHLLEVGNNFSGVVSIRASHKISGKPVEFKSSFFGSVKEGRINKAVNLVDYLAVLIQIGSLPVDVLPRGLSGQSVLFQGR